MSELTVRTWGPRSEQPVVIAIHGITATHLAWPFLAAALLDRRVVAPDLRGRGGSRMLPAPYGLAAHADDVAALIREVTPDGPADVVGHSMGGFIAVVLAQRHPDLVGRLVLVDGGLPFAPTELETTRAAVELIKARLGATYSSPDEYVALFQQHPAFSHDWSPEARAYATYDAVERSPGAYGSSASLEAVLADQADIESGPVLGHALAHLPAATFLHAPRGFVDDPPGLYAPATVEQLAQVFPQVEMVPVESVNHYTIVMSRRGAEAIASVLA
ncbi:alpha/beta fold hydrolase [Nocardioides panzhihuensis]|uniref:Pimeloyl-ACP methyl ester carboxylesterase n=1 Tax=Nocardioides panzhihuensis TaxID=860243 RepID=A0A7Z0ISM3_9ACTN|nr:alpha/beta hydrolase [Nocardioides panzhihuensis]NYI78096.1 pimeloyl-ACP methyl ester carboxylesterase [Nocardioides panzhihuensis]